MYVCTHAFACEESGWGLNDAAEAHESHREQTGGEEGDRCALHCIRHFIKRELLADTCEEDECEAETECCCESEQGSGQHSVLSAHRQFLGTVSYENSYTENTAVSRDERQEDAECLIEGRTDLLQDDLNHLHEGSDDEDEEDRLEELQAPRYEQHLQQVCNDRSEREHENNSCAHTHCGIDFLTYSQERANTQELAQYDIINKYRRDED